MMHLRLNAIGLFVKDMATMVAFYRDVVGFAMEWDGSDPFAFTEQDGIRLMMFGRRDFEKMTGQKYTYPSGNNGSFELALDVAANEEVDNQYRRMISMGATPVSEPKTYPWGLRSCFVADPEGNLIEIATWKSSRASLPT